MMLGLIVAVAVLWPVVRLRAEEPAVEFLHAAQDQGYGEVAIDYLGQLSAAGKLSKQLTETLDLELSRSYRLAVAEAFNAAEAEQRLATAQQHLDKFLKEHPNHPEVVRAIESWGDITLDRALEQIRLASISKDPAQKSKCLTAARAALEEARPRFAEATARYLDQYTKLKSARPEGAKKNKSPAAPTKQQRRAEEALREAETRWLEARFKSAKIDFYLGQTYEDHESLERKAAFAAAGKAFDRIFQAYRESLVGLHAHLWQGRAADAMGNDLLALDIYDEVLATAPEGRERETGLEPLFAQVQYHRLLVVLRGKNGLQDFLAQAVPWLQLHRTWKRLDGYQGVMLETAKAHLKEAADLGGGKKSSLMQSALTMLAEVAKVHSEHQPEALLLRRQYTQSSSQDPATAKTFDEATALGESALENRDWPAAVGGFTRALELSSTVKDAKRLVEVQNRLDQARYQGAVVRLSKGEFAESLAEAQTITHDHPASPLAPAASALAVSAALSLYIQAEDKPAALDRLVALADEVIERWPDKAEADDARIALGQASLVRGDLPTAAEVFEHVNPRSARYASAMFLAGQTRWRMYLAEKSKSSEPVDQQRLAAHLGKAEEELRTSLAGQKKELEPGKSLSRQIVETQLLLGELKLAVGQTGEAAELLAPLVLWIRTESPDPLDNALLRVFVTAVRAELSKGDLPQACATADLLLERGPDTPAVNAVLISLLKTFVDAWKQAEAAAIEARTAADPAPAATTANAAAQKNHLSEWIVKLAKREHYGPVATIYIADTCAQLGQTDLARELYQSILATAERDPGFKESVSPSLVRIQAQLVGLLRQKGNYAEGITQVDRLIEAMPNALEPQMEKGRLLQGWAEVDPTHAAEAIAHWTALRTRLAKARKKPPEYYEVVYNAAACLFADSAKTHDGQKALQAEQLLNATLVLSPQLNGPEMVAKYKELLQKVRQQSGRTGNTSAGN